MTIQPDLEAAVGRLEEIADGEDFVTVYGGPDAFAMKLYRKDLSLVLAVLGSSLRDTHRASSDGGSGWLDIASAPRDGTEIIAYSQDVSGVTGLNPFVSLCAWHPDAGFCTCELREVTHWMPLPAAPGATTANAVGMEGAARNEPNPQPTEVQALCVPCSRGMQSCDCALSPASEGGA